MSDLERSLAKWRQEMVAAGVKAPEVIRELEGHLRDDIAQQMRSGISASDALRAALEHIGQPGALRDEFALSEAGFGETLRRHKRKVFLCTAAGLLAAGLLQWLRPAPYQSETKLLFRYAMADATAPDRNAAPPVPPPPTSATEAIKTAQVELLHLPKGQVTAAMNVQMEILTSLDLAREVAEKIGPRRILAGAGGGEDLDRAAAVVRNGLLVQARAGSSVLQIAFRHPDPSVGQPVLRQVVDSFLKRHVETHRAAGALALSAGQISNITLLQMPSTPLFDFAASFRMLAALVGAGVLAGFVWVLVIRWQGNHADRGVSGMG